MEGRTRDRWTLGVSTGPPARVVSGFVQSGVLCMSCFQAMTLCSAPDTKRVGDCLQGEDLTTMAHMEGSNPLAPTKINQQNRPSIDGHRRLKAIFVGDSKIQFRKPRESLRNPPDFASSIAGGRRTLSGDFGGRSLP